MGSILAGPNMLSIRQKRVFLRKFTNQKLLAIGKLWNVQTAQSVQTQNLREYRVLTHLTSESWQHPDFAPAKRLVAAICSFVSDLTQDKLLDIRSNKNLGFSSVALGKIQTVIW